MNKPYYCSQCNKVDYFRNKGGQQTMRCWYGKTPKEIVHFTGIAPKDQRPPDWCPINKEK